MYVCMYVHTYVHMYVRTYVCMYVRTCYVFQEEVTPIMFAMVAGHSNVVDLLKNKYGQEEPFPEAVSRHFFNIYI